MYKVNFRKVNFKVNFCEKLTSEKLTLSYTLYKVNFCQS